ncbi:peptide deformylase [Streptomyces sp. NPDC048415]|uniref:peptide deformylase n=1 Tax=Streptomyces sp. NPDC048415 TaxID=3154822 RepID=UPI00343FB064
MSELPALMTAQWPLAPSGATDGLLEPAGDGITGFMPPLLPDAAWCSMPGTSATRVPPTSRTTSTTGRGWRMEASDPRASEASTSRGVGTVTGGDLGRADHPGPGWRRLRWAEPARRTGDPLVPDGLLPSRRCLPLAKKEGVCTGTPIPAATGLVTQAEEGCSSVPGVCQAVHRPEIGCGLDQHGVPVCEMVTGYAARCLSHELDHLDRLLYLDLLPQRARLDASGR